MADILWVEDNARFVGVVRKSFLAEHTLTVCTTLAEARALLNDKAFDLILLDYDLIDGKGDELLPNVLALPQPPPVIATSSHERGNAALVAAGATFVCAKAHFGMIATVIADVLRA